MAKKKKNTPQKPWLVKRTVQEPEREPDHESDIVPEPTPQPESNEDDDEQYNLASQGTYFKNVIFTTLLGTWFSWYLYRRITALFADDAPELRELETNLYFWVLFFSASLATWMFFEYYLRDRNIIYILYRCMKYHCKRCKLWKIFSKKDPDDDEPDVGKPVKKLKLRPQPSAGMSRIIGVRRRR